VGEDRSHALDRPDVDVCKRRERLNDQLAQHVLFVTEVTLLTSETRRGPPESNGQAGTRTTW